MSTVMTTEPPRGFNSLSLSPPLLSALEAAKYFEPTPIQAALIPEALTGKDVIGQAQTGTGKTAAFLLPFLNRWEPTKEPGPQGIVLAPTRELVVQVCEEAQKLAPDPNFRALAIYGGQRFQQQLQVIRKGFHLAVGTPGRVLDHLGRGTLNLDQVRYLVLDEADRMLDIGFRPDIERILRRCPRHRQTLLLSATLPPPVLRLAHRYMADPLHINLSPQKVTVQNIHQSFITVDPEKKFELLLRVLHRENPRQCIIFCETKRGSDELFDNLTRYTRRAAVMHGDLDQPHRERIMRDFRSGKVVFLVATDVVGRGIDVTGISHILNYDLPEDPENYVHRIGRTGRMGKDGIAISFVTQDQGHQLTRIESFINQVIHADRIPGFKSFTRKVEEQKEPKTSGPVFGRRVKKYSNRL